MGFLIGALVAFGFISLIFGRRVTQYLFVLCVGLGSAAIPLILSSATLHNSLGTNLWRYLYCLFLVWIIAGNLTLKYIASLPDPPGVKKLSKVSQKMMEDVANKVVFFACCMAVLSGLGITIFFWTLGQIFHR